MSMHSVLNPIASNNYFSSSVKKETEEEKEKKEKYQDIFTYPDGLSHLKYFEKIPHPEKFTPEMLAFAEAQLQIDLNIPLMQKKLEFEIMKNSVWKNLSPFDKKLLYLPDLMEEYIKEEPNDETGKDFITAYRHLQASFLNYFGTPVNYEGKPDIQWIDYDFAARYAPAQKAIGELKANIMNPKGFAKIAEKLLEASAFGDEKRDFYLWNTSPYYWSYNSTQMRVADVSLPDFLEYRLQTKRLPPQYWALGNFSINALPEGYVRPKGNGLYDICVTKVYLFINDNFNFEGDQKLGPWNLKNPDQKQTLFDAYTFLNNEDFRNFQKHGYGGYFPVLSRLHQVEDFAPVCREYHHVK